MKFLPGREDRGLRLDVFLASQLSDWTRSHIQSLNTSGAVLIEGRQEKAGYRIRGGETIDVDLTILEKSHIEPQHIPIQIHYEDEDLAVIEKPAGLVVHPGAGTTSATVVHGLLFHFQKLSEVGGEGRPGIVHRLDKWTSGLLVVAKNDRAHVRISRAFQDRHVGKTYLALVHGNLPASGDIDLKIGRHSTIRTRMAAQPASADPSRGRVAHTSYRVLESLRGFSLLEVKISTGRTHQIRVHLSALGHPVVGDDVYGERQCREFEKRYGKLGRYFLHAAELRFPHPTTGVAHEFHSPLPADLSALLERIRG